MCFLITDGPKLLPAAREHTTFENCPVSLVCGYNLDSNPPAVVTWRDPWGRVVTSDGLYTVDSGPDVVKLDIASANREHEGVWTCTVIAIGSDGSEGRSISRQVNLRVLGEFWCPSYLENNLSSCAVLL